ncbi:stromal cell-derived factor 2 [Corythoichthys intestinalis]|uniref:stromal cell-derived factor 2 n=1 Tax=Corythoichthys intestinalis TaxID=161448 RepID=UPI0025A6170C|nr:stromal cell-derived factor 2 [Corythoichthys intestinalis]
MEAADGKRKRTMDSLNYAPISRILAFVFVFSSFFFRTSLGTELTFVTCGSVLKLLNIKHNVRLHSHDVRYGSGSGQQSVTGVTSAEDSNSYWRVRGTRDATCLRGSAIKCGQNIRLTHVNTGRNLHSHYFSSPLTSNQEVSAFGEEGEGDHLDEWTVECGGTLWERAAAIRFRHKATEASLAVTGEQYGRPISGQYEVHAAVGAGQHGLWRAAEGVFVKPDDGPHAVQRDAGYAHTEF